MWHVIDLGLNNVRAEVAFDRWRHVTEDNIASLPLSSAWTPTWQGQYGNLLILRGSLASYKAKSRVFVYLSV